MAKSVVILDGARTPMAEWEGGKNGAGGAGRSTQRQQTSSGASATLSLAGFALPAELSASFSFFFSQAPRSARMDVTAIAVFIGPSMVGAEGYRSP